ncbi:MAG: HAD hydrolase family protein [Bacteroidales bacterium]|nr:HAD hydrolase family protein [Bacteroidales bacterium]MCB9013813.1 HAD hydrolase family protein [Bacteroidales bacterium]
MSNFKEDLAKVKAFVFDVDGVFATSKVLLHPSGDLMRTMNIKDGYAVHYSLRKNYIICIISGGTSESVRTRFQKLGVTDIYLGSHNKMDDFRDFLFKYDLKAEDVLYMGDDLPDYEVMQIAGVPTCPSDAVEEIKSISSYISDKPGGEGCVRDIIEQVLRLHGKWMDGDAFSW